MFTAKLLSSTALEDVQCLNCFSACNKTVVIKTNGDFDIYTNEGLHTYRRLWCEPIIDTGYSESLSTLFVQCSRSIILFNMSNMEQYEKIVDKRGILRIWCIESDTESDTEVRTILVALLNTKLPRLKVFTWTSRAFSRLVEVSLSNKNETINSISVFQQNIVFATNQRVYLLKHSDDNLTAIDKSINARGPTSLSTAVLALEQQIKHKPRSDNESLTESFSWSTVAGILTTDRNRVRPAKGIRYLFKPDSNRCCLLDGHSEMMLQICATGEGLHYLRAFPHERFFHANSDFDKCLHMGSYFMVLYNQNTLRIVDYEHGFSFLTLTVPGGIKAVFEYSAVEIMIWTSVDTVIHYRIDLDEDMNVKINNLGGSMFDLNFDTLERRVVFYDGILRSSHFIVKDNRQGESEPKVSYTMKLRDLYIVYALQALDKAQGLFIENGHSQVRQNVADMFERVTKFAFDVFLEFLAPPVLILSYCFPEASEIIKRLYALKNLFFSTQPVEISMERVTKSFLPYLIEVRRHLRNINKGNDTYWTYNNVVLKLSVSFFQSHNQKELSSVELLTIIDTTLFQIYLRVNKSMVGALVRVENNCDFESVENGLKNAKMIRELIDFYLQNKQHEKALSLLMETLKTAGDLKPGVLSLIVDYLKKLQLENLDMVFQYSDILLSLYPEYMQDILTSIYLAPLSFSKNLQHLKIYYYLNSKSHDLSLSYLEFVVGELQCTETRIFGVLLERYLDSVADKNTIRKLHAVLRTSKHYDAAHVCKMLKSRISDGENTGVSDLKTLKHLLVYPLHIMKDHETALSILWHDLEDYNKTSEYCSEVYEEDPLVGTRLLLRLLDSITAITVDNKRSVLLKVFLTDHGFKLESDEVLKRLPNDASIADLSIFVSTELKKKTSKKNELSLLKNILHSEVIKTNFELAKVFCEFFVISEDRICPICNKPLKNSSSDSLAIMAYKDKTYVMHLPCAKKLEAKIKHDKETSKENKVPLLSELSQVSYLRGSL